MEKKKSNGWKIALGVIVGAIILIGGILTSSYNSLVNLDSDVSLAKSNVETMMQRRLELIPDLVSTVKSYAKHEEKVYEDISNARAALNSSLQTGNTSEISEANNNLTQAVNKLLVIAENYPELTAGQQYTALMDQLEGSVNRISNAREEYNVKVNKYNKKVRSFPTSILASMFGFDQMDEFKADPAANQTNMVDFGD